MSLERTLETTGRFVEKDEMIAEWRALPPGSHLSHLYWLAAPKSGPVIRSVQTDDGNSVESRLVFFFGRHKDGTLYAACAGGGDDSGIKYFECFHDDDFEKSVGKYRAAGFVPVLRREVKRDPQIDGLNELLAIARQRLDVAALGHRMHRSVLGLLLQKTNQLVPPPALNREDREAASREIDWLAATVKQSQGADAEEIPRRDDMAIEEREETSEDPTNYKGAEEQNPMPSKAQEIIEEENAEQQKHKSAAPEERDDRREPRVDPDTARPPMGDPRQGAESPNLTEKQIAIGRALASGMSIRAAADRLGMNRNNVMRYVQEAGGRDTLLADMGLPAVRAKTSVRRLSAAVRELRMPPAPKAFDAMSVQHRRERQALAESQREKYIEALLEAGKKYLAVPKNEERAKTIFGRVLNAFTDQNVRPPSLISLVKNGYRTPEYSDFPAEQIGQNMLNTAVISVEIPSNTNDMQLSDGSRLRMNQISLVAYIDGEMKALSENRPSTLDPVLRNGDVQRIQFVVTENLQNAATLRRVIEYPERKKWPSAS